MRQKDKNRHNSNIRWASLPHTISLLLLSVFFHPSLASGLGRQHRRAAELYEVRVFENAPLGTKATLNEAFDRSLREMNSCFAQLESDLDWLDFDPVRLLFETVAELPENSSSRPAQFAVLHLLCPQHRHSLHFSVHITRRNRHPPRFSTSHYRFYAPANLPLGAEIGRVNVQDLDPIIYNSQIQLSIVRAAPSGGPLFPSSPSSPAVQPRPAADLAEIERPHWDILRNGSLTLQRPLTELQLFRPYPVRLLAVDFGSPQLFSLANVTVVPVSVSDPQNLRVNVANSRYQVFEWDLPAFGVPERFRLALRRRGESGKPLHEQELEASQRMAMTRIRLPANTPPLEVILFAVDVEGETPSEAVPFQVVDSELSCGGHCSDGAGVPMCYYAHNHQLEQYREGQGQQPHCLCFAGFSGPQCRQIEHCPAERLLELYGGVDWPETAVNRTAGIPCPYNEDGRTLERKCGWDPSGEGASWANATNGGGGGVDRAKTSETGGGGGGGGQQLGEHCRTQASVLVHLGVLANYGQRSEQTLSGLHSVLRFLFTLLQFPAFNPRVQSAHFDAKIAEHVAQVLDFLAARNFSATSASASGTAIGGGTSNASALNTQLAAFLAEFACRLPVPFSLQSTTGGLHMRTWELLPSSSAHGQGGDGTGGGGREQDHQEEGENELFLLEGLHRGVQLGPCHVQPSGQHAANTIARAICLRNSTMLPQLDGHSPLLMLALEKSARDRRRWGRHEKGGSGNGTDEGKSDEEQETFAGPLVLGLRLPPSSPTERNYTCAQFDQRARQWTLSGIVLLSRELRPHGGQVLLCELQGPIGGRSVFALLPEHLFHPRSALALWLVQFGPLSALLFLMGLCLLLLFASAFSRSASIEPAQLVLLLSLLLLHLFHLSQLLLAVRPSLPFSALALHWPPPSSTALFSLLQLALLSFAAALAILNASVHARIVQLELELRKTASRGARLFSTLVLAIALPLALCVLTVLLNGQILVGLDSAEPRLLPFNWVFGLALLLPLVLLLGSAMGFGAYSLWYGNSVASSASGQQSDWPLADSSAALIRRKLLHQLSCAGGLSLLVLLFPSANLLVLLQPSESLRSAVLSALYLSTFVSLWLLFRVLSRIQRRMPGWRDNQVGHGHQGPVAFRNHLNAGEDKQQRRNGTAGPNGRAAAGNPVRVVQHGQAQPILPGEVALLEPNEVSNNLSGSSSGNSPRALDQRQSTLDRQYLLRRPILPASLMSTSLPVSSRQFRHHQQLSAVPALSLTERQQQQQRLSGTVSTSAGTTVLLESDDLASLDRAICSSALQQPQLARLFADVDAALSDDDEEEEEDLDAFLEEGISAAGTLVRHRTAGAGQAQRQQQDGQWQPIGGTHSAGARADVADSTAVLAHPLVSVV